MLRIGQRDHADAEPCGRERMAAFGAERQRQQHQRHRDQEAQRLINRDGEGGDQHHPHRVGQVAPG